jgi:N-acetyl-beta-hexosaminidase
MKKMNISLTGDCRDIEPGLQNLLENFRLNGSDFGNYSMRIKHLDRNSPVSLKVSAKNGPCIGYKERSDFFRALCVLLQNLSDTDFEKQETALFEGRSAMIDLSRNAVYTVPEMKHLLCSMALCGFNRCYLYMEDTYELPGYPYFGYLRGRYSLAELKQIDDFADSLGIEAIPCIQTLAHLKNTLKWDYAKNIKDTNDVLLVGEDETYRFIESMIAALKKTFRTNKIHIGMDEAAGLGTGVYLNKHGYENQFGIMMRHLKRVNEIAKKYGMEPMIWDDMFYRSHNNQTGDMGYYDPESRLNGQEIAQVPENISLVYWDYYHDSEKEYDRLLSERDRFPNDIIFAGGIWKWIGYVPSYSKTFLATNAALPTCKKHKIKEIMATVWSDDGSETPIETIIPGIILFGEHCFGQPYDDDAIDQKCRFLTGLSLSDFRQIEQLDLPPEMEYPNVKAKNPSKYMLYQDLLLGAFDPYMQHPGLAPHYRTCERALSEISARAGDFSDLFAMYAKLARVLSIKATLGIRLRKAYLDGDREGLRNLLQNILPDLKNDMLEFKKAFTKVWFHESKGCGFEVIDIRLGGVISRIDTVSDRIGQYLNGETPGIEELDEILLPFAQESCRGENYIALNHYLSSATQNVL